ncbi:MAG TPA: flagellar basal body P-ring formation chaperone FlgA [Candidatus Hydrogenedentes bacterium]|nr:flagellar basal body P-ring formation chaperone FlgA [Candidatus Hydrogenedentota bacterium]
MALKRTAVDNMRGFFIIASMRKPTPFSFIRPLSSFSLFFGLFLLSCSSFALSIAMKSEATVADPMITIGDVAMVSGEGADAVAALDLGPAPEAGAERRLTAAAVATRIRGAGWAAESIEMMGAPVVRVMGPCERITRDVIAEDLRRFIESKMPWTASEAEIEIARPPQDLVLPPGEVVVEWQTDPHYRYVGPAAFRGVVTVDGKPSRTILCRAKVEAYTDVVVAATALAADRPIELNDVTLERRAVSTLRDGAFLDPAEVAGMVPRVSVPAGQALTKRLVLPRMAVKRNQLVTVETQSGGLAVTTEARADMDGAIGSIVTCTNLNSKQPFQGVVRADGVVVIR